MKAGKLDNTIWLQVPTNDKLVVRLKTTFPDLFWDREYSVWRIGLNQVNYHRVLQLGFLMQKGLKKWQEEQATPKYELETTNEVLNSLYPFQREAVAFLDARDGRALLADEMGLGKTIEVLAWLSLHRDYCPCIIVCPASLKVNWMREAQKWIPSASVHLLAGTKPPKSMSGLFGYEDIYIINYDVLKAWRPLLESISPKTIVFDESHYLKGDTASRTKQSVALAKKCPHVLCLSGTPIVNRPVEIYNSIKMIDPNLFGSRWAFVHRYCAPRHNGFGWVYTGASHTAELNQILTSTVMLRRRKEDVLKELPEKRRIVVPFEIDDRRTYDRAESDFLGWLKEVDASKVAAAARAQAMVQIEYLKQLSVKLKMASVYEWIDDFLTSGQKLVVFGVHREVLDNLQQRYSKIAVKIDGSTLPHKRTEYVDAFQLQDSVRLLIGNIKAAGVGLTLTAASTTCFVEMGWTPGEHSQAEDRCHRIGQEADSVLAYYLVGVDTIEERLAAILDRKSNILSQVLDGRDVEQEDMLSELLEMHKNQRS